MLSPVEFERQHKAQSEASRKLGAIHFYQNSTIWSDRDGCGLLFVRFR